MKHEKMKGRVNIARPRGSGEPEYVQIEVNDELSGANFISIRIPIKEFTEALFGLAQRPCEFDLRPDLVGLKHEWKEEFVPFEDWTFYRDYGDRNEVAAEVFAPFEVDGWKGRVDDLFNHHRRGKGGARVVFVRYVPVEAAQTGEKVSEAISEAESGS